MGVLCFGFLLFALAFPLLVGVPFCSCPISIIFMFVEAPPPPIPPPHHRYLCVCPEVNDMVVCLGGGLPLVAFTHRRRYYGEASGAQLNFAQDGANLPENCDGACVLSGCSLFFHALMLCLYCGMPNGISIIFGSAMLGNLLVAFPFLSFLRWRKRPNGLQICNRQRGSDAVAELTVP